MSPLNVPMILLNVIDELRTHILAEQSSDDNSASKQPIFEEESQWAIREILRHVSLEKKAVFENVRAVGDTGSGQPSPSIKDKTFGDASTSVEKDPLQNRDGKEEMLMLSLAEGRMLNPGHVIGMK